MSATCKCGKLTLTMTKFTGKGSATMWCPSCHTPATVSNG